MLGAINGKAQKKASPVTMKKAGRFFCLARYSPQERRSPQVIPRSTAHLASVHPLPSCVMV